MNSGWIDLARVFKIKIRKKLGFPAKLSAPKLDVLIPSYFPPPVTNFTAIDEKIADRFKGGETLVFGEYWVNPLGDNWRRDFFSNYTWKKDSPAFPAPEGADVKIPWELARMQHWSQLAWRCYLLKDAKLAQDSSEMFVRQVEDFWESNPNQSGVNWSCAMDVAIRAVSLVFSWDLFCASGVKFSKEWEKKFCSSIYQHQDFVYGNLEWVRKGRSNHYLANLAGLLVLESYLPRRKKILSFLKREFVREILRQFHADGSNFEASTAYHMLSSEMAAWGILALERLHEQIPKKIYERVLGMRNFLSTITLPCGKILQIGDNDSGRFLKISPAYEPHRMAEDTLCSKEVLALLNFVGSREESGHGVGGFARLFLNKRIDPKEALKFENSLKKEISNELVRPIFFRSDISQKTKLKKAKEYRFFLPKDDDLSPFNFPQFGIYGWKGNRTQITVRCGHLNDELMGAHAHFDQLSVDLYLESIFIQDPGSFVYTGDRTLRNFFRSPSAHFMPRLNMDGFGLPEANEDIFRYKNLPIGIVLGFQKNSFWGQYEWESCLFQRKVTLEEGELIIADFCTEGFELVDAYPSLPFRPTGYRQKVELK